MPLRLYFDQDSLNQAIVRALRIGGVDVLTSNEAGLQRASDEEQLEFSTEQGRAIFTANRGDFARLHRSWLTLERSHGGIVTRARQQMSVGEQVRALRRLAFRVTPDEMRNRFEYLEAWADG